MKKGRVKLSLFESYCDRLFIDSEICHHTGSKDKT